MDSNPFDPNESAEDDDDEVWAGPSASGDPSGSLERLPAGALPADQAREPGAGPVPADETQSFPALDKTQTFPLPPASAPAGPEPARSPQQQDDRAWQQPAWQPLPAGTWAPPGTGPAGGPGGYGAGQAPPAPWAPGGPGGYLPYGPEAPPPAEPPRKRRTGRTVAVAVAVAVLIAAAATTGVLVGRQTGTGSSTATTALQKIPQPQANNAANTKLDVSAVASKVDPATVDITSILTLQNGEAEGTGMILTSNGEVLTNNHVIEGASSITAQVDGVGKKYAVRVLGVDPTADVALVLLEGASNLRHVSVGNSAAVKVGDPVVAIGNALGLGGTPTVTSGIVSAIGRSINASDAGTGTTEHLTGLIQTDAPINPGNSGGPLVDAAAQVIGMDTAAYSGSGTQTASNVGFAIPINRAIAVATDIQQGKSSSQVILGTHGIMGVDVETVKEAETPSNPFGGAPPALPVNYGAVVYQVLNGSPAQRAGITSGDVIIGFDGHKVTTISQLGKYVDARHAGQRVSVTWVTTSGTRHTASLTLEQGPAV